MLFIIYTARHAFFNRNISSSHRSRFYYHEGDTGFFVFAVLVTFEIGFLVFALKIPGFSVLVSAGGFRFFPFCHSGFGFYEQKSGYSVLASNSRIVRTFLSSLQKIHLHMRGRQWKKRLLWLNIEKNFLRDNAHQIHAASSVTGALSGP